MGTLVAVGVLAGRVESGTATADPGQLAAALEGELDHALVTEALRAPGPGGVRYPAGTTGIMVAEVVSANGSTMLDEDGDASDWVELHNPTDGPIDVGGFHLSDDDAQPQRWRLPSRVVGPGERLVVFASGKDRAPETGDARQELHTDFSIDQAGEPVLLVEPGGAVVADRIPPVPIPRDASLGRHPDDPYRTCLFAHPSPGERNADVCHEDLRLGAPAFSEASGFHTRPVELTVELLPAVTGPAVTGAREDGARQDDARHDGAAVGPVLFTLDGSYPDLDTNPATRVHDPLRDGPLTLTIDDRSDEPTSLAQIWTGFEIRFPQRVEPRVELQATVVRARTEHGRETVATYFVGEGFADLDLPVVSLAADPAHLFDDDTGIYVPGTRYQEYVDSDDFDPQHSVRVPANANERGRAWERPFQDDPRRAIRFEYCADPAAGTCDLAQDIGLRIHGNFSRALPQKNLRLYARPHYGDDSFDQAFFGGSGPTEHRRLLLRGSGNDWGMTMLWDGYLQTLIRGMEIDTQAHRPTVVFLNGEYWGVHNLRERFDRHYLAITHDVDPDEVVMLARGGVVDEGEPEDGEEYLELIAAVDAAPLGDPETVARVEREIDIEGLFDTVIARTVLADTDWPHANVRTWRVRREPTGTAADRGWPDSLASPLPTDRPGPAWGADDGRWRFMNFDLDHSGDGFGRGGEGHATALTKDDAFDALGRFLDADEHLEWAQDLRLLPETLLAVPAYREAFVARYHHHLDVTFAPARTVEVLDELAGGIEGEMGRHSARWGYPASVTEWRSHVDEVRRFMQARPDVARAQLEQHLGE